MCGILDTRVPQLSNGPSLFEYTSMRAKQNMQIHYTHCTLECVSNKIICMYNKRNQREIGMEREKMGEVM